MDTQLAPFFLLLLILFTILVSGQPQLPIAGANRLTWPQRKSIILDVAKGLAYLHYEIKPPIYHCDIKATNILLDSKMKAKVADFGLAKQGKGGWHIRLSSARVRAIRPINREE
ncbi:hypothetical protein AHAS_Ahas20G0024700 [Arachis hypogaea]